ncbi:polysaccharide deacetylase family protein [Novosphingobium pentaromativorans]|uniref:Polysaccharide deacetylase n=1 Tax=Novosphingobium pentaromativorans US6-1 TaxID=1088721 RepID=G6EDL2_9SPHN|nr:polysaccharide deacetylase [Novosphingobium pentaromativorans US6-1]
MKRLLVSIHDVAPHFEGEVDRLLELLTPILGGPRLAMLVVPNHWGKSPIGGDAAFRSRLRSWSDAGIEMFVHGWFHKDLNNHTGLANLKARHMTAGEGEFLGLDYRTAFQRMSEGKYLLEDITGQAVAGFIAPAWLYGHGAMRAIADCDFALAEDHMKVWQPSLPDKPLALGPVVTWASRSPARTASSLAFAALARKGLHLLDTVRIAVHPGDVTKTSILNSIEKTVVSFARRRSVGRYADLLENEALQ